MKMAAEADERPKRRRYTTAERMKILEAVEEVGVVEAARGHGVPQTTVSNWLHRDATKVAKEKAAQKAAVRAGAAKGSRKRRGPTTMATAETAGLIAAAKVATAPQVEASNAATAPQVEASNAAQVEVSNAATAADAATAAPQVEVSNGVAAAKAPKAAKVKTEPEVAKEAKPVTVLPKPGMALPNSLLKRVARS